MALRQHSSVDRNGAAAGIDHGMIFVATILLLAVATTLGLRAMVPFDALAPMVATVLFGLAAIFAGVGLLLRRYGLQINTADVAGILTFIGVGVSIAIEPDQMVRLMTSPDPTD